ncbi:hypothetical protein KTR10_02850 [Candidatus Kaiserbacteria bacterium]|nr:hypothetical protein [Candidatus Kaiserbacteria bacterium]
MDTATIIATAQQLLFWIVIFGVCFGYGVVRGSRALVGLIMSLYIAFLVFTLFPYQSYIESAQSAITLFVVLLVISIYILGKVIERDEDESAFENFGKKVIFGLLASALIVAYSYHVVPVTEFITPGSFIHTLFEPAENFFWWMVAPLVGLAFFGRE